MGRFLFADLETAYFGGGRESLGRRGKFGFLATFFLSPDVVSAVSEGAVEGVGATSSAFVGLGCDEVVSGLLSARGCLEGIVGFCFGGCALSLSVRDSVAARSAARWASCGDDGCSEEALGGRDDWTMGLEFAGGSVKCQLLHAALQKNA
jgi:hypothetical protein